MQRVTHCLLNKKGSVFLLNKPRRNWWVAPGGKMEPEEHLREAVCREYYEETNLKLVKPELKAVSTIVVLKDEHIVKEWMLYSFYATDATGNEKYSNHEGVLEWKDVSELATLPMAAGDTMLLDHLVNGKGVLYSTFYYTEEYDLLRYRMDKD